MKLKSILLLLSFLTTFAISCRKSERLPESDVVFSTRCHLAGAGIENYNNAEGVFTYTRNVGGILVTNPVFIVEIPGKLPMHVCNMPSGFESEEDVSRNVRFSGRMEILPSNVDASSTAIELSYLKFQ